MNRCGDEARERQYFIDAMRECLGKAPLYDEETRKTETERFYVQPFADVQHKSSATHA